MAVVVVLGQHEHAQLLCERRRAPAETLAWCSALFSSRCAFHPSPSSDDEHRGHTDGERRTQGRVRQSHRASRCSAFASKGFERARIPLPHPDCAWFILNNPTWIFQPWLKLHVAQHAHVGLLVCRRLRHRFFRLCGVAMGMTAEIRNRCEVTLSKQESPSSLEKPQRVAFFSPEFVIFFKNL